jgi:hypothetical protein
MIGQMTAAKRLWRGEGETDRERGESECRDRDYARKRRGGKSYE